MPRQQKVLQVNEYLAVGGAVSAAQLPAEGALQLPEERVGQSCDAFQAEDMAAGKVLWPAVPPARVELLKADFTLQQVDLDLSQNTLSTQVVMTWGAKSLGHG